MAEVMARKSASQAVAENAATQQQEEEEVEELEEFAPIEHLEKLGVNRGDIQKAKAAGYHTCQGFLMNPKKTLTDIKGLSEAKVDKLLEAAKKMVPSNGWSTASEYERQRTKEIIKITTGSSAVDALLGGGIETRSITEVFGEYRTGKTQICHTLCVTTQMPVQLKGGAGKVAYLDTEGSFVPERIRPIAERFDLDPDAILENIVHARAYTSDQQMELLVPLAAQMAEEPFKLVIMDSITALMRVDYTGRGELAERQQNLNKLLNRLKKLANEFNVAIVITNQVMSDPSGGAMFVSDPKKPAGGHIIAHASTVRLSLRKGKAEQRVMKLVDAPHLPEGEASYAIAAEGIIEYKD